MAASYIEVDDVSAPERDWAMNARYLWASAILPLVALVAFGTAQTPIGDQLSSKQARRTAYQSWLDEDVRWIITDHERAEYLKLKTDFASSTAALAESTNCSKDRTSLCDFRNISEPRINFPLSRKPRQGRAPPVFPWEQKCPPHNADLHESNLSKPSPSRDDGDASEA